MANDPRDDLIYQLVEKYKGALLSSRIYQDVATTYGRGQIDGLVLEKAQQHHRPFLVELFREFDQARERGLSAEGALRLLLAKLDQSVR